MALGVGGAVLATLSVPAAAHPGAMQNSSTDRTSSDSSAAKASVFFGLQARPAFPSAPEPDYRICDFVKHQFLISRLGTRTRATQRLCLGSHMLGKLSYALTSVHTFCWWVHFTNAETPHSDPSSHTVRHTASSHWFQTCGD